MNLHFETHNRELRKAKLLDNDTRTNVISIVLSTTKNFKSKDFISRLLQITFSEVKQNMIYFPLWKRKGRAKLNSMH